MHDLKSEGLIDVVRVQLVRERHWPTGNRCTISDAHDVAGIVRRYLELEDREHFVALLLDSKGAVTGIHTVSIGTLNAAMVSPREVFKAAILANAASIVVAHNHPSGDPTPSPEDEAVTEMLVNAGKLLGIEVLDHVIVGDDAFHSMRRDSLRMMFGK